MLLNVLEKPVAETAVVPPALPLAELRLALRLQRGGNALPWLGPALRGITLQQMKNAVCLHPPTERDTRWKHCAGCPFLHDCPYGRVFEPRPAPHVTVFKGQEDGLRLAVLAPSFPQPARLAADTMIPLRILLLGQPALRALPPLLGALLAAGRWPGLGPDHLTFDVEEEPKAARPDWLRAAALPPTVDAAPALVPRVLVELTAPLCLNHTDEQGRKRRVRCPSFADLLRAALRGVSRLFLEQAAPLGADFAGLKRTAGTVRLAEHGYRPFRQRRWSNRTEQRYEIEGVIGWGAYHDVPLALLPWLAWGGRLHVGEHRVAGAGGWRTVME